MVATAVSREQVLEWVEALPDPEIPVLTIADLGIVRGVTVGETITVELTPTYSGCPATEAIEQSVIDELHGHGLGNVAVKRVLSPPWTTEWITAEGRRKLKDYGIAPPVHGISKRGLLSDVRRIACPRCDSVNTAVVSEFGSTACKASYKCSDCLEPFEYFKCI